jgi:hypothetical protein
MGRGEYGCHSRTWFVCAPLSGGSSLPVGGTTTSRTLELRSCCQDA